MSLQKNQVIQYWMKSIIGYLFKYFRWIRKEAIIMGESKARIRESIFEKTEIKAMSHVLKKNSSIIFRILCIDEVDRLFSNERSIIYDLFEWPYKSSTTLIVIGIANSIDLVEKSLPLLKINKGFLWIINLIK